MEPGDRVIFDSILCATDLSSRAEKAVSYATALARAYSAKLLLCHCLESPRSNGSRHSHIMRLFEGTMRRHLQPSDSADLDWEGVVIEGDPVGEIPREASKRGVDLIVICSRHRPHAAALLGSTAESICRTAPCPVLVTHPEEHEWIEGPLEKINLKRVLVAHDFSDDSDLALRYALSLVQEYQAELHLVHVLQPSPMPSALEVVYGESGEGSAFQEAARRLERVVPADALLWCEVKQAVREGQPYREVLAYAEQHEIDLICMGVRGADFGYRTLFGSNADRVLRQAPCPILIVRSLTSQRLESQVAKR